MRAGLWWMSAAIFLAGMAAGCATGAQEGRLTLAGELLFDGVAYRMIEDREGGAKRIHVLEVDLGRVTFEVTPGDRSKGREFIARTTSDYLTEFGLQAAVNGGYFTPFKGGSPGGDDFYPHAGDPVDVSGASISGEREASPVELAEDKRVNAILCIEGRHVVILDGQGCAPGTDHAMAAGPLLLADGVARDLAPYDAAYASAKHPRTAVGLSADGRRAWVVVIDGRQAGFSEGASLEEVTTIFTRLGASDAINLDGGGSTTMAVSTPSGPHLLNSPIHTATPGRERPSANHLGIRGAAVQSRN
jgi:hypothetical protein